MAILSRDESELLKQANRRLTLMHKRAKSDLNVEKAITFVESDLSIINKGAKPRFKVTSSMTERQKKGIKGAYIRETREMAEKAAKQTPEEQYSARF